jgi:hypothetical protein
MQLFANPFTLFVIITLSLISTVIVWRGVRERNVPALIMGTGIGIPTFSLSDYRFWICGVAVTAFGFWLHRKMTSL